MQGSSRGVLLWSHLQGSSPLGGLLLSCLPRSSQLLAQVLDVALQVSLDLLHVCQLPLQIQHLSL